MFYNKFKKKEKANKFYCFDIFSQFYRYFTVLIEREKVNRFDNMLNNRRRQ